MQLEVSMYGAGPTTFNSQITTYPLPPFSSLLVTFVPTLALPQASLGSSSPSSGFLHLGFVVGGCPVLTGRLATLTSSCDKYPRGYKISPGLRSPSLV